MVGMDLIPHDDVQPQSEAGNVGADVDEAEHPDDNGEQIEDGDGDAQEEDVEMTLRRRHPVENNDGDEDGAPNDESSGTTSGAAHTEDD